MAIKFNYSNKTPIHEGGEGLIFKYGKNKIIKIYKPNINIKTAKNKVEALIQMPLPKEIIKPIDVVVDNNNKFIGYVMNEVIDGEEIKKLVNKKFTTANNISTKDVLQMLVKIKEILNILHNKHIYIGDLNDKNILFDKYYNIYFIDCDSWVINNDKCDVYMDLFLDPLISNMNFNDKTDNYAFSIIAWETLTRVHPFGGTYKLNPSMNIIDRMKKGISVIDNADIVIPKIAKSWKGFSPNLLNNFKLIYENKDRTLINDIEDMYNNLSYCKIDNEYYYSKYTKCPFCDASAKVVIKPISQGTANGFKLIKLLNEMIVKTIINENSYIDKNDFIIDIRFNTKCKYEYGCKYYFYENNIITDKQDVFIINNDKGSFIFDKKYKSNIIVSLNSIYYITKQNTLSKVTITNYGNSLEKIDTCSIESYFDVNDNKYCIINYYFGNVHANIDGSTINLEYKDEIINYGIHHDKISNSWLVILENKANKFITYVLKNKEIVYKNDAIYYNCLLDNICFYNSTIFIPIDGNIRGYSYAKSLYKNFACDIVSDNSKLLKKDNKFIIINDDNIYSLE